jgi:lysyl-tRNA synthetase class 1
MSYAQAGGSDDVIARVPFNHLVAVFQAARKDESEVKAILERTGYEEAVASQWPVIARELQFVENWLDKYAPENVKFTVQDDLPDVDLSPAQTAFLDHLAKTVEAEKTLNGQGMHDAIYAAAELAGVKPGQAFVTLYRVLLNKDSGPKAGWFLASLDQKFLRRRLRREG